MNQAARQLFGQFPRAVGSPLQHIVHSWDEFQHFCEEVCGRRNAYSSLSWYPPGREAVADKVSFDLDSPMKGIAFPEDMPEHERVEWLREDEDQAEIVLGPVVHDARKIAERAIERDIQTLGVYTGMGIHIHLFHQQEPDPKAKVHSTVRKWNDELSLSTSDEATLKDQEARIMRIPNMKRVHDPEPAGRGESTACDLWTVPLKRAELASVTVQELMDLSLYPRPKIRSVEGSRPPMEFHESYYEVNPKKEVSERRELGEFDVDDEELDYLLDNTLQMPCMAERIKQRNPEHETRLNTAVLLFNTGYTPEEVIELFSRVRWVDWNRSKTEYFVRHAWRNGYSDMNCETIKRLGLCTREGESCPTEGWSGGKPEWKDNE